MQHLPSIQFSSGAEPLDSQWRRISPSLVLSVQMLEVCTPFRNWIAWYNTWGGAGGAIPWTRVVLACLTYNSCSTNKWFKIDPSEAIYFYCPLLRAFCFLTYMSAFEIETLHSIWEVCVLLLHAQRAWLRGAPDSWSWCDVLWEQRGWAEESLWVWVSIVQFLFQVKRDDTGAIHVTKQRQLHLNYDLINFTVSLNTTEWLIFFALVFL